MIRTRIAPSPTGYFHIGTARTALFNYLFAKKNNGVFIVRIEDTDIERSKKEFEDDILEGLKWLGIQWDEGPGTGGECAPYRQSERMSSYTPFLRQLADKDLVYPCYCSKEELEQEREMQVLSKQPPRYSGTCADLSASQRAAMKSSGKSSTLRFRIPRNRVLSVVDHIRGELTFDTNTLDDFIIAKDFDAPLYNFAVVIDDYQMKISHIIRGEEHISNIPKQILLDEAFGFTVPEFAHLPLILNPDRTKLSKRQNKVSLLEYRTEGYLPQALVNFMALLGWNPGNDRELFTLEELEKEFSLERVNKSGAIFDLQKLEWFNAMYIRGMSLPELTSWCIPYLIEEGYIVREGESYSVSTDGRRLSQTELESIVRLEQERIHRLREIPHRLSYVFTQELEYDAALLIWKKTPVEEIKQGLLIAYSSLQKISADEYSPENLEDQLKKEIQSAGMKNGVVLWPLRVALTGLAASPSPFEVASVLGKKRSVERIKDAEKKLQFETGEK
ncbi:glutamate--tRNA ligase [Candidatus Uhrbacteria bacterium]|nr:glutamate--tRNA ligase [Candidatus Uhrbacteria bacterium]